MNSKVIITKGDTLLQTNIYSLPAKDALVACLEQTINRNYSTWNYGNSPFIGKIKESKNGFYYDCLKDDKYYFAGKI